MENIEEVLVTIKETLVFLVEQEKIRGEEVDALNDKIEAVNKFMMDNIVNPSIAAYKEEQFDKFNEKYGERLGKYNDTLRTTMNDPEYDATREAFNELDALSDEEKKDINEESYIENVEQGLSDYVDEVKKSLGLTEDAPVEITADSEGNIDVKADTDGDGKLEDISVSDKEVAKEDIITNEAEDAAEKESDSEEKDDLDEALEAYLNK